MHINKFINILKSFSAEEIKEFGLFIKSPFYNRNNKVIKYFDIIKKYYPNFDSYKVSKENVFKKIFPEKIYNDLIMRILISDCIKLAEGFLIQKRISSDNYKENLLLLSELSNRNLDTLFISHLKRFLKNNNDNKNIYDSNNEIRFLNNIYINRIIIEHNIKLDRQIKNEPYLISYGENLISYFLTDLIKLYLDLNILKDNYNKSIRIVNEFFKNFNLNKFLTSFSNAEFQNINILKLYYNMYLANKITDNDKVLNNFQQILKENINFLSKDERYEMYIKLESLIIDRIERGRIDLYNKLFEVYKYILSNIVYKTSISPYIRIEMFRNVLFTAITLGKLKWAQEFINNYINELAPEFQENMKNHSLAILFFAKKNFDKSLEYASKVTFDLFVQKADLKILILKIYYEMKEYELAFTAIDSFSKFLSNNKNISELFKNRFNHFLIIYKMLIKYKSGNKLIEKGNIGTALTKSPYVLSKRWLQEKINEL